LPVLVVGFVVKKRTISDWDRRKRSRPIEGADGFIEDEASISTISVQSWASRCGVLIDAGPDKIKPEILPSGIT
jgi:hypothetical protein